MSKTAATTAARNPTTTTIPPPTTTTRRPRRIQKSQFGAILDKLGEGQITATANASLPIRSEPETVQITSRDVEVVGGGTVLPEIEIGVSNYEKTRQTIRGSSNNQERNNELQTKAYELEALFAVHKQRINKEQQSSSSRRSSKAVEEEPPGDQESVKNDEGVEGEKEGKFYERYMKKREERMKVETESKRAEKVAMMTAMREALENSRMEMEEKFGGSPSSIPLSLSLALACDGDRRELKREKSSKSSGAEMPEPLDDLLMNEERNDSIVTSRDSSLTYKHKIAEPQETLPSSLEDHDPKDEVAEEIKPITRSTEAPSKAKQARKSQKKQHAKSSTSKNSSNGPPKKVGTKSTKPGITKQDKVQDLSNSTDVLKENPRRPSITLSRSSSQLSKSHSNRKSISDDNFVGIDDKDRSSVSSIRRRSIGPTEIELHNASQNLDIMSSRYLRQDTHQQMYNKLMKNGGELKPFLRKGSGRGGGTAPSIAKLTSVITEGIRNGDDIDEKPEKEDVTMEVTKNLDDVIEDEDKDKAVEETRASGDSHADSDMDKEIPQSGDSGNSVDFEFQHGDFEDPSDDTLSTHFNPLGVVARDSLGVESTSSWNSRPQHVLPYGLEMLDIDPLVDSPVGSPAWNNSAMQLTSENDAMRMRKQWGMVPKPVPAGAPMQQSRKDGMKGLRRFLKFGRKSKGSESSVSDWISVSTTSFVDEDVGDGHDFISRLSGDSRLSRLALPPQFAYDGVQGVDGFAEHSSGHAAPTNLKVREDHISGSSIKAPKSFFSLSFRSKGSGLKG